MTTNESQFQSGQVILHKKLGYRGVVVTVDETFQGSEDWYDNASHNRPSKDQPWYHVLVDGSDHETYVAEKNLERDSSEEPVQHPLVGVYWDELRDGQYLRDRLMN